MCGIAGIIRKKNAPASVLQKISAMTEALRHRGPDGDGFLYASSHSVKTFSSNPISEIRELPYLRWTHQQLDNDAFLAFGHRRLSILDLSACGHQPMSDHAGKYWITYNGEIYNYLELKKELTHLGHQFHSQSDTEVVIAAYKQWGEDCVQKFNGMWSFCLYDAEKSKCFASRDRLGVKPYYYTNSRELFAFASEQKAFVKSGILSGRCREDQQAEYLLNGKMEFGTSNFFEGIEELFPGHNLVYDIKNETLNVYSYFNINDVFSVDNEALSEKDLIDKISFALEESVRLRLRSDVEVGTCLSGGIDSSALAVTMSRFNKNPISCFTAVFRGQSHNEEQYADLVAKKIKARHYKIEPTLEQFWQEVDDLIYSQDVPIWSTSTFAQHKVMQLAANNNIKVVLDGQGADELFAGYHHHFVAKWNHLFSKGRFFEGWREMKLAETSIQRPVSLFVKEKIKTKINFRKRELGLLFTDEYLRANQVQNSSVYFPDVNFQLANDIGPSRLKAFLKCEDRAGMWHSVESRTPFSDDIHLIKLLFSFHGNKKIQKGVSKYLLREAVKEKLPEEIYRRYDKVGFETPMEDWLIASRGRMLKEIESSGFSFLKKNGLTSVDLKQKNQRDLFFKLFVLSRWKKLFGV